MWDVDDPDPPKCRPLGEVKNVKRARRVVAECRRILNV